MVQVEWWRRSGGQVVSQEQKQGKATVGKNFRSSLNTGVYRGVKLFFSLNRFCILACLILTKIARDITLFTITSRWFLNSLCTAVNYTSYHTSVSMKTFNTLKLTFGVSLSLDNRVLSVLSIPM